MTRGFDVELPALVRAGLVFTDESARLSEFNPYHDARGRFASKMGSAYAGWQAGLSPEEVEAVDVWQTPGYAYSLNAYLRNDLPMPHDLRTRVSDRLDDAVGRSKLPEDMTVYRGTSNDAFTYNLAGGRDQMVVVTDPNLMVGKTMRDKGFLSTSLEPETAIQYAVRQTDVPATVVAIKVKAGSPGAYLPKVGEKNRDFEAEILMPRGQKLHFTDYRPPAGGGFGVLTAEVIE